MLVAMNRIRYSTAVIALLVVAGFADAQEPCLTPKNMQGQCIDINVCPTLNAILQSPQRKPEDVKFLRDSQCGATGRIPKVCCEDDLPCTTPSGESGVCKKFKSCPSFVSLVKMFPGALPEPVKTYIRDSTCQGVQQYSVCCGGMAPDFSTLAPPADLDATFDAKRCGLLATEVKWSMTASVLIGGTEAAIDQYPWLALMEYRAPNRQIKLLCGAVLIGPKYILTAGHCVKGDILDSGVPVSVRLGEHEINNLGRDCQVQPGGGEDCTYGHVSLPIEEIVAHPDYNPLSELKRDDIAIVRLQTPAPYTDFIRHICMPTVDVSRNFESNSLHFSVAGWSRPEAGWGGPEAKRIGDLKLYVEVPFKTLEQCQAAYAGKRAIQLWDKQLCAGMDSCNGNSGGPLMFNNEKKRFELVGIVSFGSAPCDISGVPGVFSKVITYVDWIRTVVRRYSTD